MVATLKSSVGKMNELLTRLSPQASGRVQRVEAQPLRPILMVQTTGYARARSQREVERYCTQIGQACSYKVGHTAWMRARDEAKKRLGAKFDIRQFHEVLREGAMPLSILERRIRERTESAT